MVECLFSIYKGLGLIFSIGKLGMVVQICNISFQELEVGDEEIKVILGYYFSFI